MDRAGMQPESFIPDPFVHLVGLPQTKHSKILIVVEMLWYEAIPTLTSRTHHSCSFALTMQLHNQPTAIILISYLHLYL